MAPILPIAKALLLPPSQPRGRSSRTLAALFLGLGLLLPVLGAPSGADAPGPADNPVACACSVVAYLNTGIQRDAVGNPVWNGSVPATLPLGSKDPFWRTTSASDNDLSGSYALNVQPPSWPVGTWVQAKGAVWNGHKATDSTWPGPGASSYKYVAKFTIPTWVNGYTVEGRIASDDVGTLKVAGVTVANNVGMTSWTSVSYTQPGPIPPGTYDVEFSVQNQVTLHGFIADLVIKTCSPPIGRAHAQTLLSNLVGAGPSADAGPATGSQSGTMLTVPAAVGIVEVAKVMAGVAVKSSPATATATSTVESFSLLGGLARGDGLLSEVRVRMDGPGITSVDTGGSGFASIAVGGITITAPVAPNTVVPLPGGLGSVVLYEVISNTNPSEAVVNMVHVHLAAGSGADIIVGQAYAGLSCGPILGAALAAGDQPLCVEGACVPKVEVPTLP